MLGGAVKLMKGFSFHACQPPAISSQFQGIKYSLRSAWEIQASMNVPGSVLKPGNV